MYGYQRTPQPGIMAQPMPAMIPGLKGRPVSSIEEAKAAQIDFDGSLFIFPDVANKRIYTKQINMDGSASMNMYELVAMPEPQSNCNYNFITRDEFDAAMNQIKESIAAAGTKPAQTMSVNSAPSPQPAVNLNF